MKPTAFKACCWLWLTIAALASGHVVDVAYADDKREEKRIQDHDQAIGALKSGSILPLPEILAMLKARIEGEIIETEFEYEHGRPVYEFKYVDRKGRVRELYVDARTGTVLKDKPD